MWGWTTPKATAFALLDEWYAQGFREVDGATNYPIDKNPEHFRLSENILREWIKVHGVSDLQLMVKIGSVDNLRTPEHILTKSFVLMMLDEYRWMFGSNLATLMVHWDNREDAAAIHEMLEAFDTARHYGLQIGLSGIRHPEIYAELNREFNFDFRIQLKHNVLQSDYGRYAPFHGERRFIAYGINAGGLKLNIATYASHSALAARGADVTNEPPLVEKIRQVIAKANGTPGRPLLSRMNEIGLIYAFYQPDMQGILLGVSDVEQLKDSIGFYEVLRECDFRDVFEMLVV
jgi:aryl-alcohol dehydrogenase-like predicted oxidoreductase